MILNIELNTFFHKFSNWHRRIIQLEAQWAEPVSLTFHSASRKLNTEPPIGVSHQLAKQLQRGRYLEVDQTETRMACGGLIY